MPLSDTDTSALLQLWFAGPALQVEYDPLTLTPDDRAREAARLNARKAYEWRVSRALQRRLLHPYQSSNLSHSAGHALWAASSLHQQIGVDLERIRQIDELALAELIAHDDEKQLLRTLDGPNRTRFFYRLWTLKEALVKAVGGDFPADMLRVGIRPAVSITQTAEGVIAVAAEAWPDDVARALRAPLTEAASGAEAQVTVQQQPLVWHLAGLGGHYWHGLSAMIGDDWMMAVVWPAQDSSISVRMLARHATPGEARVLPLSQSVVFGVGPQSEV